MGDEDYADFFQFQVGQTSIVNFGLSGLSADADLALYQDLNGDGELGGDEIIFASERSDTANESIENVTLGSRVNISYRWRLLKGKPTIP